VERRRPRRSGHVNCRPYADTTGYDPRHLPAEHPCATAGTANTSACWQPLSEDDGKGKFSEQQFVVPHIGRTARPRTLSRQQVDARVAPDPEYNYTLEASLATARVASLAEPDKAEIRFFDSKLDVAVSVFMAVVAKHGPAVTYERMALFLLGYTASEYYAGIVVWKEKAAWSLVRPTTLIRKRRAGDAGDAGASGFETIVKVMPHPEYPSGSACLCQGIKDYAGPALQLLFGDDELPVRASVDPSLQYPGLAALAAACGQSRLDGGMHFTTSVPAGGALCSGIGRSGAEWAQSLLDGGSGDAGSLDDSTPTACPMPAPAAEETTTPAAGTTSAGSGATTHAAAGADGGTAFEQHGQQNDWSALSTSTVAAIASAAVAVAVLLGAAAILVRRRRQQGIGGEPDDRRPSLSQVEI